MQTDEALGALRGSHQLGHADGRSIRREDRVFLDDGVELRVSLALFGHVLDDGLDDDVAVGKVLHVGGALEPRLRGRLLLGGDAALFRAALDQPRERLLDAGKTLVEKLLFLLEHDHVATRCGRDLRDARAHQTTTEYANFFDIHEDLNHCCAPSGPKSARQIKS